MVAVTMIWDGMSSVEANATLFQPPPSSLMAFTLRKITQGRPAHSGVEGRLHRRLQRNAEISGSAVNERIGVPPAT